ncbi:MAG: hypothetical protein QOH04_2920 [Sphingomonadales bacterium]|jgi:hypothetical protein|nr:hypothetical protein [Sphingomonadales bacterium]MEA3037143.1 hypothetical protein [Sphingomonadales bacterium]
MKSLPRFNRWLSRAPLFAAAVLFPTAASADFLVVSQNALHLGQNSNGVPNYIVNKNAFIRGLAHWPGNTLAQMTFLQEVMTQADQAAVTPAGGSVHFSALKGNTTYLERYADLLVNDAGGRLAILCHVDTAGLTSPGAVQRAPEATLISDSSSGTAQLVWFLDYHATFGTGGPAARRGEIAEIGNIVKRLTAAIPAGCPATTPAAVVVGDWNMNATDASFAQLAANAGFARPAFTPNVKTSLNAQGATASPYDHFIWDDARVQVTLAALPTQTICSTKASFVAGILSPTSGRDFRRNCSDHLGIAAIVKVR